jgi:hypothetical protein
MERAASSAVRRGPSRASGAREEFKELDGVDAFKGFTTTSFAPIITIIMFITFIIFSTFSTFNTFTPDSTIAAPGMARTGRRGMTRSASAWISRGESFSIA